MNYVDAILILIVLIAVWSGWRRGFIAGVLDLASLLGGIAATFFLYPFVASFVEKHIPSAGIWTLPISFLFTYIVIRIILSAIMNRIANDFTGEAHENFLNRFFGMLPGFVNGVIYATIVAALLLAVPINQRLSEKTHDSQLVGKLALPAEWVESKLSPVFKKPVERTMNKMIVEPDSKSITKLPFTVPSSSIREDLEAQMLNLVNEERTKRGLQPLKADPALRDVARAHSKDMFARGYFSHYTPEGKDPFQRMREAGVKYEIAGENLALTQTLQLAHAGLMNSPGHRANILRPQFGRVGIAVLDGGSYGIMVTQDFRN
jgi:uncharacterized protein YkwD